jgi:hypothetical protein
VTPFSIYCTPAAAPGVICPATAFRPARPSTTSFASSSVIVRAIWAEPHMSLRERMGREVSPWRRSSTANRSNRWKRCGNDDQVGYDAGKQVRGRKIHAPVDSEGRPMRVVVHSAAIQDRDGARKRERFSLPRASGRCRFGQWTFAGACANDRIRRFQSSPGNRSLLLTGKYSAVLG